MPKQMFATVVHDLPTDEFEEARAKLAFKEPWDRFLADLQKADIAYQPKLETLETNARPATRKKRAARQTVTREAGPVVLGLAGAAE